MKNTEFGNNRLGSGGKMQVELHAYERSTHNLSYKWRNTQAPGTIVPFLLEVGLPGDTWEIDLEADIMTHPTLGPLFGSFKFQCDVFEAPMRLYNRQLIVDSLNIGMNMQNVKFPIIGLTSANTTPGPNSYQINPSCLLNYLGINGLGTLSGTGLPNRNFNAMPLLAYWDIFKNYYANKQETNAWAIHTTVVTILTPSSVTINAAAIQTYPSNGVYTSSGAMIITYPNSTVITVDNLNQLQFYDGVGNVYNWSQLYSEYEILNSGGTAPNFLLAATIENIAIVKYGLISQGSVVPTTPTLQSFPLTNIDSIKESILSQTDGTALNVGGTVTPYTWFTQGNGNIYSMQYSQEGLAVKTYQSDVFNNWLQTSWQTQIQSQSAVSTASSQFTIDSLNLAYKIYNLLNRIATSGGSYTNYIEAVFDTKAVRMISTPMYRGGMAKEILFQTITSTAASSNAIAGSQPLGQLAGKGMTHHPSKRGGKVTIKPEEHVYIIGLCSITPRIDYSQGNRWFINLFTMDDLHKPALDQIGFQQLITDQMAYWDTLTTSAGVLTVYSAGYQPSWTNYMTNYNRTYGNFAIPNNEMFMTLNRRYSQSAGRISDLTTYIDPSKYNFIWAQTSLDSMNFWVQIAVEAIARRKMSAKLMPNL